jgi:hypothetical protein
VSIDVRSAGDIGGGAASAKSELSVEIDDEVRVRLKVCRREDEKPREEEGTNDGEGGRVLKPGDAAVGVRSGLDGAPDATFGGAFFLLENGRKNAHSDSNLIESNSEPMGE